MTEWGHARWTGETKDGKRWCVLCRQLWPCDAEQMRLRAEAAEAARDRARATADEIVDKVLDLVVRSGTPADVATAQRIRREWREKPWSDDDAREG